MSGPRHQACSYSRAGSEGPVDCKAIRKEGPGGFLGGHRSGRRQECERPPCSSLAFGAGRSDASPLPAEPADHNGNGTIVSG
jgi:hypothetical protein